MNKLLLLASLLATSSAFSSGGEINEKTFGLCQKQDDFIRFAAIASTGKNVAVGTNGVPLYRQKGRDILLKDNEIDLLVDKLSKDTYMRSMAMSTPDAYTKRMEVIKCSQLPEDYLISYDRLKSAGKL